VNTYTIQGNILICERGDAYLADFGISVIMTDPNVVSHSRTPTSKQGLTRYMAPEQIAPQLFGRKPGDPPSKESDVHSLAMTIYEVRFPALPLGIAEEFPLLSGPHGDRTILRKK